MKKVEKIFSDYLDDIDDLKIETDQDGISSIYGLVILNNIAYKVSVRRSETDFRKPKKEGRPPVARPLYTGTISIISIVTNRVLLSEMKRRKRVESGREYKDKDIYASITYQCNSADPHDIAAILRRQIDTLYRENCAQLKDEVMRWIRPDQLTPELAYLKYVDEYLSMEHRGSEHNEKRKKQIQEVFSLLPCCPLGKLKSRDVDAILEKKHISLTKIELCSSFVSYLIGRDYYPGRNPFPSEAKRELTPEALDKKAFTSYGLSVSVFNKLVELIDRGFGGLYCAVALLLSGFFLQDIINFRWRDLEFKSSEKDFVIVHFRKDELVAAIHDFSRPIIPDSALYLRKVYKQLCNQYGKEAAANFYIASEDPAAGIMPDREKISVQARNLLVRAGHKGRLSAPGRLANEEEHISIELLRNNYQSMLLKAGLQNDPDTYRYLCGTLLRSTTYTNYESHTSPAAQYRFYTILKTLSTEKKMPRDVERREDGYIHLTIYPKTNHEVVRLIGSLELGPGEKIIIRSKHGITGSIAIE